jgi:hypothetical protein
MSRIREYPGYVVESTTPFLLAGCPTSQPLPFPAREGDTGPYSIYVLHLYRMYDQSCKPRG